MAKCESAVRLQTDVISAMKAKQKHRLGILRMIQAAVKQVEVDQRKDLDDDAVQKIISSYARKVKDQIKGARDSGREDLLAQAESELEVVAEYLPAELTDDALEQIVCDTIEEIEAAGPQDMGKVMKAVMPKVAGRADGGRISSLVKKLLVS